MKKIMTLMLALLLTASIFGCVTLVLPESAEDEALDALPDYAAFNGNYNDSFSDRAFLTAQENDDHNSVHITVDWSDSDSSYTRWEMNAQYDGKNLVYKDCMKSSFSTDENGDVTEVIHYTGGEGYFEWDDGSMKWIGASEADCRDCVFE